MSIRFVRSLLFCFSKHPFERVYRLAPCPADRFYRRVIKTAAIHCRQVRNDNLTPLVSIRLPGPAIILRTNLTCWCWPFLQPYLARRENFCAQSTALETVKNTAENLLRSPVYFISKLLPIPPVVRPYPPADSPVVRPYPPADFSRRPTVSSRRFLPSSDRIVPGLDALPSSIIFAAIPSRRCFYCFGTKVLRVLTHNVFETVQLVRT